MKNAIIPSLRVDPALRRAGESLSSFMEQSLRANIERRQVQQAFVARRCEAQLQICCGRGCLARARPNAHRS
jgi:hypothetical protein